MGEVKQHQGVKVSTVRGKCVYDNRREHIPFIAGMFLVLLLVQGLSIGGPPYRFLVPDGMWIAYVLWFVARKLFHYTFLAQDGVYIVKFGYAVRIPWDMVESAEVVVSGRPRRIFIHFRPWPVDEKTGTLIVIQPQRDEIFPCDRKTLEIFKRHTNVTVSA